MNAPRTRYSLQAVEELIVKLRTVCTSGATWAERTAAFGPIRIIRKLEGHRVDIMLKTECVVVLLQD